MADRALDENQGAEGDAILVIEVPEAEIVDFEWIEDGKPYREFLVPADQLNRYPIIEVRDDPLPGRDTVRRARGLAARGLWGGTPSHE